MRTLAALALLLAACSKATMIAGAPLGGTVAAGDARFEPPPEGEPTRAMRDPGSFEGRKASGVDIYLDGNLVVEVVVTFTARGREESQALIDWARDLCKSIGGQFDDRTPSPLGTPEPGVEWDPVISSFGECEGRYRGRPARLRTDHSRASDFDNATVTLTVSSKKP